MSRFAMIASFLVFVTVTRGERERYDGHQVWRVTPKTQVQLDVLASLHEQSQKFELDFWKEPSAVNRTVVMKVTPARRKEMYLRLGPQGLFPEITITDVQIAIDEEQAHSIQSSFSGLADFDYSKYHPLSDVNSWMEQMADAFSDRVQLFNISSSYEKRNITAMKVVGKASTAAKPGFFFNGGIHAREWISPATVIYMTAQLIEKYDKDPVITQMVDAFDWYVLPVFNVDGYEYTWTQDRNWRKTRSKHFPCRGVDPNRNWDWHWCEHGASKDPCSDLYCGPKAFSEVEVKGVADFLNSVPGRFRAYIDFHSFSQLWMTPWGYTEQVPPDFPIQDKCSVTATEALTAVHGTKYQHGNIASTIYVASGSSADWAYGAAKVKYSTAVELRDTGEFGFLLPADQIIPSGEETLQGLLAMAQFVLNNP